MSDKELEFTVSSRCVVIVFTGEYDHSDLRATLKRISLEPSFEKNSDVICDARKSRSSPSVNEIRKMLDVIQMSDNDFSGRWAVLVGDPLRFGLTRMAGVFGEVVGVHIRPFKEMQEAVDWLRTGV